MMCGCVQDSKRTELVSSYIIATKTHALSENVELTTDRTPDTVSDGGFLLDFDMAVLALPPLGTCLSIDPD